MSSKDRSFSVSPGTALSVFGLLLYSARFIRNELKFGGYDQRFMAVEEVISKLKEDNGEMVKASISEGRMSWTVKLALIEYLNSSHLCYSDFLKFNTCVFYDFNLKLVSVKFHFMHAYRIDSLDALK